MGEWWRIGFAILLCHGSVAVGCLSIHLGSAETVWVGHAEVQQYLAFRNLP